MSNQTLVVTLRRGLNGESYEKAPKVGYIPVNSVRQIVPGVPGSKIETDTGISYLAWEKPTQVETARDPQATNVYGSDKVLGGNAAGNAQGAGLAISAYLTEIDTATANTNDSLDLPAAVKDDVRVVINSTTVTLQCYPASGENFKGLAANAAYDIPPKSRKHFVCLADGEWTVAVDMGL